MFYINQLRTPSFPIGWLKLNLAFMLDQLRLAYGDERWW